jgi:hypothetical protein
MSSWVALDAFDNYVMRLLTTSCLSVTKSFHLSVRMGNSAQTGLSVTVCLSLSLSLSLSLYVHPSIYMSTWNNSAQTGLSMTLVSLSVRPSVRPSVGLCPNGITPPKLDGISWNFIVEYFFESVSTKFTFHYSLTTITAILNKHVCTRMAMSRWIFLRISNSSK